MLHNGACRGCGEPFGVVVDSDAHIIPNALGGRLKPRGILCTVCNGELDRLADNDLIKAFAQWPTMADLPRQRDGNPPVIVTDADGKRYRVEAKGVRTVARPSYVETDVPEGRLIEISAPTEKMAKQLLAKAAKDHSGLDVQSLLDAMRAGEFTVEKLPAPYQISFGFGPSQVFPGIYAALWLFHIHAFGKAFCSWKDLKSSLTNGVLISRLRYATDGLPGLRGPKIDIGHKLVLRSDSARGLLIGYAEILGALRVGGILATGYTDDVERIYATDAMTVADQSDAFVIDATAFLATDWSQWGTAWSDAAKPGLIAHFKEATKPLVAAAEEHEQRLAAAGRILSGLESSSSQATDQP